MASAWQTQQHKQKDSQAKQQRSKTSVAQPTTKKMAFWPSCTLPWSDFCAVLEIVAGKLKVLYLNNINFEDEKEVPPISTPAMQELSINNASRSILTQLFELIDATNIKKLDYSDRCDCFKEPPTFQLKKLVMPMNQTEVLDVFDRIPGPSMMIFLQTQISSLRSLTLNQENVLKFEDPEILLESFKLKELRFHGDIIWFRESSNNSNQETTSTEENVNPSNKKLLNTDSSSEKQALQLEPEVFCRFSLPQVPFARFLGNILQFSWFWVPVLTLVSAFYLQIDTEKLKFYHERIKLHLPNLF